MMSPARRLLDAAGDRVARTLGAAVDEAFVRRAFQSPTLTVTDDMRREIAHRLHEARRFYSDQRLFGPVDAAHFSAEREVRSLSGGRVVDVEFQSPCAGRHQEFKATLAKIPQVQRVRARWFRHDRPAPAVIMLHGWGMGIARVDSRAFAAHALYKRGVDLLLIPAPFHGARLPSGRRRPMFPTARPVRACEGFAMWLADTRAASKTLRDRGAPRVGVAGMSMGGFASALLATVADDLDFVIPMMPFASLPQLMWDQARHTRALDQADRLGIDEETFVSAFEIIAPLKRRLTIPPERIHIFSGRYDRVTPAAHGQALAAHFGCQYSELRASHLVQLGRRQVFREILRRAS